MAKLFYANSEDKLLRGVLLYAIPAVGGDSIGLFYDSEGTEQVYNTDCDWVDLYIKGLIKIYTSDLIEDQIINPMSIGISKSDAMATSLFLGGSYYAKFFVKESSDQEDDGPGGK